MKKLIACIFFMICTVAYSQEFAKGKELFNANCAACHNMEKKMTGPPLKNVIENQGRDWATKWISNSAELIKSGDAHANEIFKEYNEMAMPAYEYLKTEELSSIVDYLEGYSKEKAAVATPPATTEASTTTNTTKTDMVTTNSESLPTYVWLIIIVILLVILVSIFIIGKAFNLLNTTFDNIQITNGYLMNKLKTDDGKVNAEIETIVEGEVNKRVKEKVKTLKNEINNNLKDFK